ncbi:MAG: HlyC/CorC family transporter [Elusimicrobia bacterium]|nr:HlyC/CorC family transporter [Elusimicrobiota bacterium]
MIATFILLVALLVFSGVFSSMETSLATLNRARIKALYNQTKMRVFSDWLLRPGSVFSTILIGNNFVNIAFSSVLSYIVINEFLSRGFSGGAASFAALVITSAFLLFFGEIMPKNIATTYPRKVSEALGGFLNFVSFVLRPLTNFTSYFSGLLIGSSTASSDMRISRGDIGELSENLEDKESFSKIIAKVLLLNQKKLSEVMTPREKIVGLDLSLNAGAVEERIVDSGISRFPVYYGSLKNIVGIVYAREIVKELILKGKIDIKQYAHRPLFMEGATTVLSAYRQLVNKRVHIALVTDEAGDIEGIVTMEDLLEEIFGDILDEYDLKRWDSDK